MAWYDTAVFYHIYPLGLCGCAHENDGQPTPGAFAKLNAWAEHASKDLGCTAIYIGPLFESGSHGYDTIDYRRVDRRLGTNEEFEVLCREAAKYGIGIVLDGVFSHTGSDSRYFNREGRYGEGGAYRDPNSPYRSWYDFDPKYKGGYRSWWGFETLPEVNEETPSYVEFITGEGGVIDTWLRRGAAGFRLDVLEGGNFAECAVAAQPAGADVELLGFAVVSDRERTAVCVASRLFHFRGGRQRDVDCGGFAAAGNQHTRTLDVGGHPNADVMQQRPYRVAPYAPDPNRVIAHNLISSHF